jgi:hypothetical protein
VRGGDVADEDDDDDAAAAADDDDDAELPPPPPPGPPPGPSPPRCPRRCFAPPLWPAAAAEEADDDDDPARVAEAEVDADGESRFGILRTKALRNERRRRFAKVQFCSSSKEPPSAFCGTQRSHTVCTPTNLPSPKIRLIGWT